MNTFQTQTTFQIVAAIVISLLIAQLAFIHTANAGAFYLESTGQRALGFQQNTSEMTTEMRDDIDELREYTLVERPEQWAMAQELIVQMMEDTMEWLDNGGLDGESLIIVDPIQYVEDGIDQTRLEFIQRLRLELQSQREIDTATEPSLASRLLGTNVAHAQARIDNSAVIRALEDMRGASIVPRGCDDVQSTGDVAGDLLQLTQRGCTTMQVGIGAMNEMLLRERIATQVAVGEAGAGGGFAPVRVREDDGAGNEVVRNVVASGAVGARADAVVGMDFSATGQAAAFNGAVNSVPPVINQVAQTLNMGMGDLNNVFGNELGGLLGDLGLDIGNLGNLGLEDISSALFDLVGNELGIDLSDVLTNPQAAAQRMFNLIGNELGIGNIDLNNPDAIFGQIMNRVGQEMGVDLSNVQNDPAGVFVQILEQAMNDNGGSGAVTRNPEAVASRLIDEAVSNVNPSQAELNENPETVAGSVFEEILRQIIENPATANISSEEELERDPVRSLLVNSFLLETQYLALVQDVLDNGPESLQNQLIQPDSDSSISVAEQVTENLSAMNQLITEYNREMQRSVPNEDALAQLLVRYYELLPDLTQPFDIQELRREIDIARAQ